MKTRAIIFGVSVAVILAGLMWLLKSRTPMETNQIRINPALNPSIITNGTRIELASSRPKQQTLGDVEVETNASGKRLFLATKSSSLAAWTNAIPSLKLLSQSSNEESWSLEQDKPELCPTITLVGAAEKEVLFSPRVIWIKSTSGHARRIELRGQKMNIEEIKSAGSLIMDILGKDTKLFDAWCSKVGNTWIDAPEFDSGSYTMPGTGQIIGFQMLPTYSDEKPWSIYFVITDP